MNALIITMLISFLFNSEPNTIVEETGLIDGTTLTYVYEELGTVTVEFNNGLVSYEWLDGPFKGTAGKDFPYDAKKIDKKIYFVHWFESSRSSLVSLVINLKAGSVNSSALLNPNTEEQEILFHQAEIKKEKLVEN